MRPVLPPAALLTHCVADYGGRTFGEVIEELARLVECERADKDALKAWSKTR